MRNQKTFIEELGNDRLGTSWYVLIDETYYSSENNVSFYVFPEENLDKHVRWEALHIMRAYLSIIPPDSCIMLDFCHNNYDTSYRAPHDSFIHRNSLFGDIIDYGENWENRGIGTLLLNRVESWAVSHGIKIILGSLSPSDHIEKLKYFYPKHGWVVEIPAKTYVLPDFVIKGVGIVYKRLQPLS